MIPVIHQGTQAARNLVDPQMCAEGTNPSTYVWVGKWRSQHIDGGGGLGPQSMGLLITATVDHEEVFRHVLGPSSTQYEPSARNTLGGYGAYRELPPTQERIDAVIAQAATACKKEAN